MSWGATGTQQEVQFSEFIQTRFASYMQSIFGIVLHDHVPNVDILNRCNTFLWSLTCKAKDSGGQVTSSGCLIIDYLRRFSLVKSRGFAHLLPPRSTFNDVTSHDCQPVVSTDLIGMLRTDCSGETRLARPVHTMSQKA